MEETSLDKNDTKLLLYTARYYISLKHFISIVQTITLTIKF